MWEKASPLGLPGKSFQGDNFYTGENLDPVAMINYYYDENYLCLEIDESKRKKVIIFNKDVFYPDYESLKAEMDEESQFTIYHQKFREYGCEKSFKSQLKD